MTDAIVLMPRLDALDVDELLESLSDSDAPEFRSRTAAGLPDNVTFAAVGGRQVMLGELTNLEEQMFEAAGSVGYPLAKSAEARARFDAVCAPVLSRCAMLQSGEALRDDVWAFLACILLAPLTHWRYGVSPSRWHGGVRNTFQRLWIRARVLDRGPGHAERWGLVEMLSEDALVAITERTAIAQRKPLALAIGEGWIRASETYGRPRMEPIMRQAIVALRLRNEVTALAQLPAAELAQAVDRAFARAASSAAS